MNCRKCSTRIPSRTVIDGKERNLGNRKFCLSCSPFGSHNCKSDDPSRPAKKPRSYSQYTPEQRRKHVVELMERARRVRKKLIDLFGGKCQVCGYNRYTGALSFHHRDPATKRFALSASRVRAMTWEKALEEAKKCDLLCLNCHAEHHGGVSL